MNYKSLCLTLPLLLTACGPIEKKVAMGLMNAGLSRGQSDCMAVRMVDKLSVFQLKRLASLGNLQGETLKTMGWDRFMHSVRALKDPEIVGVVSTAGLACALTMDK